MGRVPAQFLLSGEAPPKRTLIDVLRGTVDKFPQAAAIDDGEIVTYSELWELVCSRAAALHAAGIKRGDRIGIRMSSGQKDLYVAILAVLKAGAAYVPVDADDPEERADVVFGEAKINAVFTDAGLEVVNKTPGGDTREPLPTNDAWIIFTSGSTGTPKGVAVTHRGAAAFVDAESQLFCQSSPLGPDDRVLAGLSVAFDASCEEMWLAWAHGACLVPAPRSLVRSGMDLGPWLIRRSISVVSTVPTLASLWPAEALDNVRLLIFGGEACPPELVARVATPDREVWNTYGPTEATVVACAARVFPNEPVAIGMPLAGWDLAVVDSDGQPVGFGEVGELIIGGVGLARYLDQAKDKEKFAPLRSIGWARAYRSGDQVRLEKDGLYFVGRADDQVKIGGRRIELGEVEAHVSALKNVHSCSVVAQNSTSGHKQLVAYVSLTDSANGVDAAELVEALPAALIPQLHIMPELPVTTSGKVDKKALPWPLPSSITATDLSDTEQWLAQLWVDTLGVSVADRDADFFSLGGTSLAAAMLVGEMRSRFSTVSVRDLYDHPRLAALAEFLDGLNPASTIIPRQVQPVRWLTRVAQTLIQLPMLCIQATPWLCLLHPQLWWLFIILILPPVRLAIGGLGARLITRKITSGSYPRGGATHLRIWAAQRLVDVTRSHSISGATWVQFYAKCLGVKIGTGVDLHSLPPVTGMLSLGDYCSVEPEVDLSGCWLDGDIFHVGRITIGESARIGARSTLLPGTTVSAHAHIEPGSTVLGESTVKPHSRWAGSPAKKVGRSKHRFPTEPPPRHGYWVPIYGLTSLMLGLLPWAALAAGAAVMLWLQTGWWLLAVAPLGAITAFISYMFAVWVIVRLCSIRLRVGVEKRNGITPVRSSLGWRIWVIERLMEDARTYLFPLYAAQLTPLWLRSLGARIGVGTEISTAVMVPALVTVRDGAFLADDTRIGGYELGGGWLLSGETRIGKRSFVGNSGIAGPARKLAKNSLVAVLSSAPKKSKAGSNWWGSPPERMRRVTLTTDSATTFQPLWRHRIGRGVFETLRLLAPITSAVLATLCALTLLNLLQKVGPWLTWLLSGFVLMGVGLLAMALTICMKWLCVGRHKPGEHPLWSPFVWRNELQDTFIEVVAAPWFLNPNLGTGALNSALKLLGARIGAGAWIESYWLPETDLCTIGPGATVGPGTVVQTHLFHDRVMSLDTVSIEHGASLAAHSVVLPGATIGTGARIGPGSLVMRGDQVPPQTAWQGNPVEPTS